MRARLPVIFAALAFAQAAAAQVTPAAPSWPAGRPVRMIVPYTPGGGVDTVARALAQKLIETGGGSVVVENRPGAAGVIGAEVVAKAPPDGHTLLVSATEFAINPAIRSKLPYDPMRDFAHVSQLASVQFLLVGHPSVPVRNARELVALAKGRPGQITYGSSGTGGGPHLAGELLQLTAGIRWTHVPFKGAGPASVAVMSGEIDFSFGATIGLAPHVRAGRLRAIGVTGSHRYAGLPDVPTVAESGVPGYVAIGWYGMYAPGATPAPVVQRIYSEVERALSAPAVKDRLASAGNEYVMSPPADFVAFLRAEIAKWTRVVKQANLRID